MEKREQLHRRWSVEWKGGKNVAISFVAIETGTGVLELLLAIPARRRYIVNMISCAARMLVIQSSPSSTGTTRSKYFIQCSLDCASCKRHSDISSQRFLHSRASAVRSPDSAHKDSRDKRNEEAEENKRRARRLLLTERRITSVVTA